MPSDHKAKALRLLEESFSVPAESAEQAGRDAIATALVHSNLAIAEGQKRVAEAVRGLCDLTAVAALIAAVEPFTTDGGVSCGEIERDALVAAYERITNPRPSLRGHKSRGTE